MSELIVSAYVSGLLREFHVTATPVVSCVIVDVRLSIVLSSASPKFALPSCCRVSRRLVAPAPRAAFVSVHALGARASLGCPHPSERDPAETSVSLPV